MLLSNSVVRTEVDGDIYSIHYNHTRHTLLSRDEIWQGLQTALVDAVNSWLWPHELNVPRQEQLPLQEGGFFQTTYRMQNPDSGEVIERQYRYRTLRWRPQEYVFEYEAQEGHPFRGRAVVSLEQAEDGGTLFKWDGTYHYTAELAAAEEVFSWYFPMFFRRIDQNIKARANILNLNPKPENT
jgi:hypothetical protein